MSIYLTSDLGTSEKINGERIPCKINNINSIIEQLKEDIKKYENFVFIASNPSNYEKTDISSKVVFNSFELSGLAFKHFFVIDDRTSNIGEIIKDADLIFLSGGHVPTQNEFFNKIDLRSKLKKSKAVIIGQSAGSMNLAKKVYNYPEMLSEINDPKFLNGLAMTNISIVPHFDKEKGNVQVEPDIDLMNNYLIKDSYKIPLYCVENGSHIRINQSKIEFYGNIYLIKDGQTIKISSNEKGVNL